MILKQCPSPTHMNEAPAEVSVHLSVVGAGGREGRDHVVHYQVGQSSQSILRHDVQIQDLLTQSLELLGSQLVQDTLDFPQHFLKKMLGEKC